MRGAAVVQRGRFWTGVAAGMFLAGGAWAVVPLRYADMTPAQMDGALAAAQQSVPELADRLTVVSEPFLGTPYVLGNMGEGPDGDGRDKDPRFNVQGTDCTTFVEHAMAFALSGSVKDAQTRLDAIRYDHGRVNYGTRRHWPEAQWVPGLVAEGYLTDATADVAGKRGKTSAAQVDIDVARFKASAHAAGMPLTDDEVPRGSFSVPYVPLADVWKARERLTNGMVINIVKAEKEGLLVRISHQGLVVRKGQEVFIRHASSAGPKAVMDEPLKAFLERQKAARSWPTVGFNFLRVKVPPAP